MNSSDFESQLRRQPMRSVPVEWRDEILASAARAEPDVSRVTHHASRIPWWRELLWPCPQAWAGLAAVWMLIFALHVVTRGPVHVARSSKAFPAPEMQMALRERRRLLAELIGSPAPAEPRKPAVPGPRSESSPQTVAG